MELFEDGVLPSDCHARKLSYPHSVVLGFIKYVTFSIVLGFIKYYKFYF